MRYEDVTMDEAIAEIAHSLHTDADDWYGKYLVLGEVLRGMSKKEANSVLRDQFMVMEDELQNTYENLEAEEVA